MSTHRPNAFLRDGGTCPDCGGVILSWGIGWRCLGCRARWSIRLHPDADLGRTGFPVVVREAAR
jgi:tRNA(Ile2) C34 agmatinyltransferase TiaS